MQQEPTIPQATGSSYSSNGAPNRSKREGIKSILSTALIIIAAPLIAILLITFVFQSYEVDGPSMERTLQNADRLIISKVGKTWSRLANEPFIPDRGEVVVFHKDDLASSIGSGERQLIKRVIGLPGERVLVENGHITIFNSEFPNGFNPDVNQPYSSNLPSTTPGDVDITVPSGEVFVSGDNRINSHDSRAFGTIPSDSIVGTLKMRIYPFSKFKYY